MDCYVLTNVHDISLGPDMVRPLLELEVIETIYISKPILPKETVFGTDGVHCVAVIDLGMCFFHHQLT